MFRNKTASQHNFATVPRADIPRSKFTMRQTRKQAFDASLLVPIMVEEVLPGDTWQHNEAILARLATPIAPIMDDMDLETFYFFVPNRLTWKGTGQHSLWEQFITGQNTSLTVPVIQGDSHIFKANSVFDHMGIKPGTYTSPYLFINAMPIWGYFLIYNEWFRDQNLQEPWTWSATWTTGASDNIHLETTVATTWDQMPLRANKRHDYFTSSLPWPQKGTAVSIPLGTTAPVQSDGTTPMFWDNVSALEAKALQVGAGATAINQTAAATGAHQLFFYQTATGLEVDLSSATAATINALRLAFQTQKLLERDARGGSRYVEQILSHFGVKSPDYRLQRPEYLGGSKIPITVNPIAQTAAYDTTEPATNTSPIGNLGAEMHASGSKRTFTYAATEHGFIIGLAVVRATPTYQQGTRAHWRTSTRLDYYFPVFAMIGEQAVPTQEIYQPLNNTPSNATWGYQEAWARYRYTPNEITGVLRSTATNPIDWWHLSEEFGSEPALNAAFITDKTQEVLARALATATAQWSAQIIMDVLHTSTVARLMPTYSVPGLIDHF